MTKRRSPKLHRPRRRRVETCDPVIDSIPWELYEALRQQHEALLDWVAQLEATVVDPMLQPIAVPAAATDAQVQRLRTENQELRDRLDRQQRYICQLKRALESSLEGRVPSDLLATLQTPSEANASPASIAPVPAPAEFLSPSPEPAIASPSAAPSPRKSLAAVQLPRFR
ncbi:hypothetical protein [Synechococcus elongatus]|uniref:Uncharacterized protein n=1 Tax=Synechococcus elongatus PCC 11801 TaxID=2219813 RepID=A0AAN1QLV5_SYNEL|nr:hypothetical protein [Synechococcus elongatus]AZB71788.1 hypothetical protein DOP62_02760 [Synechococcus elongatus PCC 11801]